MMADRPDRPVSDRPEPVRPKEEEVRAVIRATTMSLAVSDAEFIQRLTEAVVARAQSDAGLVDAVVARALSDAGLVRRIRDALLADAGLIRVADLRPDALRHPERLATLLGQRDG